MRRFTILCVRYDKVTYEGRCALFDLWSRTRGQQNTTYPPPKKWNFNDNRVKGRQNPCVQTYLQLLQLPNILSILHQVSPERQRLPALDKRHAARSREYLPQLSRPVFVHSRRYVLIGSN